MQTDTDNAKVSTDADLLDRIVREFDDTRLEEHADLLNLINMAGTLNKGNMIVEKIKTMEAISDKLTTGNPEIPRMSFLLWLTAVMVYAQNKKLTGSKADRTSI
jgi:hypothetical protein